MVHLGDWTLEDLHHHLHQGDAADRLLSILGDPRCHRGVPGILHLLLHLPPGDPILRPNLGKEGVHYLRTAIPVLLRLYVVYQQHSVWRTPMRRPRWLC